MSLRARLVTGLVLVASLGLAIAAIATWAAVRSFEISRVDDELQLAQVSVAHELNVAAISPSSAAEQSLVLMPSGTYGAVVDNSGKPLVWIFPFHGQSGTSPPDVPRSILTTALSQGPGSVAFGTVRLIGPVHSTYRLLARVISPGGPIFVIAVPLSTVNGTLSDLAIVELVSGAAVLVIVGLLAQRVVALGLRPLDAIVETARAIAGGDFSRRIVRDEPRTEIGRLGQALNGMLSHVEQSFAVRSASEERLRRFVADAGHELRTPLTSIRGYAELFRRGATQSPEELALAMRRIESEAQRMSLLVEDLILLERLGETPGLRLVPVNLSELAHDAVADASAVEPQRPISLEATPETIVMGDEDRLRQIFANLLTNVRVHTSPPTPVVVRVYQENSEAVIEVSDAGPGLTEEQASKVFERFYRADSARSRSSGGSGLGLSIVAAIAAVHGGTATVNSQPGLGATFRVRLSQVIAQDTTELTATQPTEPSI